MSRMHNPPHPGLTPRDDVLPVLGLSVTEAAQQLAVARATFSRVLNGRADARCSGADGGLTVQAAAKAKRPLRRAAFLLLLWCRQPESNW